MLRSIFIDLLYEKKTLKYANKTNFLIVENWKLVVHFVSKLISR